MQNDRILSLPSELILKIGSDIETAKILAETYSNEFPYLKEHYEIKLVKSLMDERKNFPQLENIQTHRNFIGPYVLSLSSSEKKIYVFTQKPLPDWFWDIATFNDGVTYSDLKEHHLDEKYLGTQIPVEEISIMDCGEQNLDKISNFKNLKVLLTDSIKDKLPNSIFELKHLESLYIDKCFFSSFPTQIFSLKGLKKLFLSRYEEENIKIEIPPEIGTLVHLEYLELTFFGCTYLPNTIKNLTKLKYLDLDYNKLTTLPEEILSLPLIDISLLENNFSVIPHNVKYHPTIEDLTINSQLLKNNIFDSLQFLSLKHVYTNFNYGDGTFSEEDEIRIKRQLQHLNQGRGIRIHNID